MIDDVLHHDLCSLIDSCIDSIEALDVLRLLHREPDRAFASADVAHAAGLDTVVADVALASLLSHGLATASPPMLLSTTGARTFQLAPLPAVARDAFAHMVRDVATEETRAAIARRLARRPPRLLHIEADEAPVRDRSATDA